MKPERSNWVSAEREVRMSAPPISTTLLPGASRATRHAASAPMPPSTPASTSTMSKAQRVRAGVGLVDAEVEAGPLQHVADDLAGGARAVDDQHVDAPVEAPEHLEQVLDVALVERL